MNEPDQPKICLKCARARMAGGEEKPCADCALLNIDPLAQVRAAAARPSKAAMFPLLKEPIFPPAYGPALKPARPTASGRGG